MQYFLPIWKLPKGKCGCDTVRLMPYLTDRASGVARLLMVHGDQGGRVAIIFVACFLHCM